MLTRIAASALLFVVPVSAALAQSAGAASVRAGDRVPTAPQSAAARRDGALMTHANEQKPKAGHSETSAGKSGK